MGVLSVFATRFCGVDEEFLLRALLLSGNARGYILGAVTELLLKEELERLGYELLRIREKWEGDKKHHGDYYIRKNGSRWFVLESKGVKSNSAKWHKISSVPRGSDGFVKWLGKKKSGEIYDWWHSLDPTKQTAIIKSGRFNESKIIETHFVAGRGGKTGREIATPLKTEFNAIALDLFLVTHRHEFIFAKSSDLISPEKYPRHIKQNYIVDILIPDIGSTPNIQAPWSCDFNSIFSKLDDPVIEEEMQIDDRKPGERAAGVEEIMEVVDDDLE